MDKQDGTTATGLLWKCPFTAKRRDCSPVDTLPRKRRRQHLKEADGQWMGSVVQSQGPGEDMFIACLLYTLQRDISMAGIR